MVVIDTVWCEKHSLSRTTQRLKPFAVLRSDIQCVNALGYCSEPGSLNCRLPKRSWMEHRLLLSEEHGLSTKNLGKSSHLMCQMVVAMDPEHFIAPLDNAPHNV